MTAQVVLLPRELVPADIAGRTVLVFDVLRATTTMTAALAAGVEEIHVFDNLGSAASAAAKCSGPKLLCGEVNCLPPPGFDLGNSPRDWQGREENSPKNAMIGRAGLRLFMCTTNGTRAIAAAAAGGPGLLLAGALVNAGAAAKIALSAGREVTLLCAGTGGDLSLEDFLGAGAVLDGLIAGGVHPVGVSANIAWQLFAECRNDLSTVLTRGAGGRNLKKAGLEAEIDLCARLDAFSVVGRVDPATLIIRPCGG